MGVWVADKPMRTNLRVVMARSRSRDKARCVPRLLPAMA